MKETLLQKAKNSPTKESYKRAYSPEMLELAIAWLNEEITTGQATNALHGESKTSSTNTLFQLCVTIREGIKDGKIIVKIKK